jgi:DNA-entry nuclease
MSKPKRKNKYLKKIIVLILSLAFIVSLGYVAFNLPRNAKVELESGIIGPTVLTDEELIPEYFGQDYIVLNDNIPNFTTEDIQNISGENYSELDSLGRCGMAYALLDRTMMPTDKRGDISQIKPSGYKQAKYEGIINFDPPYLYNRSHLIAYALTGQNANEKNLITGTHHMNSDSMLQWENQVIRLLYDSDIHVLYRVTPYFKGKELVARGVEIEAYSKEDQGRSICFT